MKKSNLQQELFDSGLIEEGNAEKIEAFKKKHRADYMKSYNQNFSKDKKQKLMVFTMEEFQELETLAKKYNMKLSPFIKASTFAYHQNQYIPIEEYKISEIESILREINSRIASSIQYIHLSEQIYIKDIENIKQSLFKLERNIAHILSNPPRLDTWIANNLQKDDLFLTKLLESIAQFLTPKE